MSDRTPQPLDWAARSDPELTRALDRQADLRRRWQAASLAATEAAEAIERAEREHRAQRAGQLARGGRDVGAFDPTDLERAAREAEQTAEALEEAFRHARAGTLALANRRQSVWAEAAGARLERARAELLAVLDRLDAPMREFADAYLELLLATDPNLRERRVIKAERQAPPVPSVEELRAYANSAPTATRVEAVAAEA